jgi:hypothetical protein
MTTTIKWRYLTRCNAEIADKLAAGLQAHFILEVQCVGVPSTKTVKARGIKVKRLSIATQDDAVLQRAYAFAIGYIQRALDELEGK